MRKEHKLHIPAALLIFGKKKVGRAALLWKISTRFVFNGKRRRILAYTLAYVMFCKLQLLLCFLCIFARNVSKDNVCYFSFPAKCAKIGIRELPVVQFRRQDAALEGRFSIMVCVKGIVY